MELRKMMLCLAFCLLAVISQCSEAKHSMQRRQIDDDFDADVLADEASEDDHQNDGEGSPDEEENIVNASVVTKSATYNITIGRNVRLQCKVTPEGQDVVVQWSKEGPTPTIYFMGTVRMSNNNRFQIVPNTTDLLIKELEPQDTGVYNCSIMQSGFRPSVAHTLFVQETPRIVRFTASSTKVQEGSDLLLTCNVSGLPPPQIIWSREADNGNVRLQEKDGKFEQNSVLIKNVRREHSGKYYCYAFNGVGQTQAELKIAVVGKPRVHVHRNVVNSAVNVEAVLQCSAHDEAAPHIRWYKDNKIIEDTASRFTVSTQGAHSNLTVTPTTAEDFGTFTCEANNAQGSHSKSIQLVQLPVIEDLEVDGPKLAWTVHSHQPLQEIEVQLKDMAEGSEWRRLNVPLPNAQAHEYTISYQLEDNQVEAGKYEANVRVKNDKGWSAQVDAVVVEVEARPEYIQHASVFLGSGTHSIRPGSTIVSAVLMYLLVRMF